MTTHNLFCGVKFNIDNQQVLWVRVPFAGRFKNLDFNERCQSGLPAGAKERIVAAGEVTAAGGYGRADFTDDEIAAMVELHRQWKEATTPRRGGSSFSKASRSMSGR